MSYIGTGINQSPVITGVAASDLGDCPFVAVKHDVDGKIVVAGAGEHALGILDAETEEIKKDGTVNIQIKDIGLWRAGAAIAAGQELASDANGMAIPAVSGKFIVGVALEDAAVAGQVVHVQIIKSGYKA